MRNPSYDGASGRLTAPCAPNPVQQDIERRSAEEMVVAVGLSGAPRWAQEIGCAAFALPSRPIARVLARFDRRIGEAGLPAAASEAMAAFGARLTVSGAQAALGQGPLLCVSNHPGAFDAFALMASIGRCDLSIIAADRSFLRALPDLGPHLLFVPAEAGDAGAGGRGSGLRRAARHLRKGGALLQFAAGQIEPDPAFLRPGEAPLGAWRAGTGVLVRAAAAAGGRVAVVIVEGVHSPRAKRLLVTQLAERRGITTIGPLIQAALPGFRDVEVRVRVGEPVAAQTLAEGGDDAAITARLRTLAANLLGG